MSKKKNKSSQDNTAAENVSEKSSDNALSENTDVKKSEENKKPADTEKALRKKYARRKLRYGSAATAVTVIVIAVVVLCNVIVSVLADRINMSIDITPDKTFEISEESINYVKTVNEPVEIVCMMNELEFSDSTNMYFKQAYEVLKKYTIYSDNISLKFVNMTEDPTYVQRYSEMYKGEITDYSIVISSAKRIKVISVKDLYNTEINYYTYSEEITSSKAEQELTSAIMYVTDPDPMNLVMWNTETSTSSYDNVFDMLSSNGYNVTEINPLTEDTPENTDIICINAPLSDYDEETVQKLYDFLDNEGNLGRTVIYIADTTQKTTSNIDALLAEWGIRIGKGVVGDTNARNIYNQSPYIIANFIDTADNEYAQNVADTTLPVVSFQSRPIEVLLDEKDNRSAKSLLSTDDTAFVLTEEMQKQIEAGEEPEIVNGSYTTMAAARKMIFNKDNQPVYSNILVVGSASMLDQRVTEATYFNNGDYFISALNTLTGKTSGINIVAKDLSSQYFEMNQQTYSLCFTAFIIVIPLTVVVIGVVVYFKRRHK